MVNSQEIYREIDSCNISFRNKREIIFHLSKYPELIPIITQAPRKIRNYFPKSPIVLEMRKDPEEGSSILMLYIQTSLSAEEAFNNLDMIDEIWWFNTSKKTSCNLCLHVEFQ